ncbi:hypothetical protein [Kitasatospora sp. NPDC098663]|uniref:hypothetical protein n=1 Tax=Kitasatospora sp. NPDC098663 TaxID=3364096 RepID=UPI003829440B
MDTFTRQFVSNAFGDRWIDSLADLRSGLRDPDSSYTATVREGLRALIDTKELTPRQWEQLTHVPMPSATALYTYLDKAYEFLFSQGPLPRDPRRRTPAARDGHDRRACQAPSPRRQQGGGAVRT